MKSKITFGVLILILITVSGYSQSPCDNPSPGNCMIPDTCCVVPENECPWHITGLDLTYMINYFKGGAAPQNYGRFDVNCSCRFNGLDVIYLVNFAKGRGPAPLCCFYICPDLQKQNQSIKPTEKKQ